jgi:hypothetical protein
VEKELLAVDDQIAGYLKEIGYGGGE